jgi:hypothetical protein
MLVHLDAVENYLVGDTDDYSVNEFLFVGSFDVDGSSFECGDTTESKIY